MLAFLVNSRGYLHITVKLCISVLLSLLRRAGTSHGLGLFSLSLASAIGIWSKLWSWFDF